jgi:sulfoxide reductase heme-binding subunit YedZ
MSTTRDYERGQYPNEPARYPDESGAYPGASQYSDDALESWYQEEEPAAVDQPERRKPKRSVDDWMDGRFKFGGSGVKRKTAALILLGSVGALPLFFMLPSLLTMNTVTIGGSVDDTLGTGAMVNLFLCLLVTPVVTLTGQRWFVPLRRWFGIMFAANAIGDTIAAGSTDTFAFGFLGKIGAHVFELMGFMMVMLALPLLITSNNWAQRKLGTYWRKLQRLTYAIWGLLGLHLILLEGIGFQSGTNGSGFPGDGDAIFHQRFYQYGACSIFLLTLRLPPVKRWIAARQKEGRNWLVNLTVLPIFALFVLGMAFFINEEIFKGTHSFMNNPSHE